MPGRSDPAEVGIGSGKQDVVVGLAWAAQAGSDHEPGVPAGQGTLQRGHPQAGGGEQAGRLGEDPGDRAAGPGAPELFRERGPRPGGEIAQQGRGEHDDRFGAGQAVDQRFQAGDRITARDGRQPG